MSLLKHCTSIGSPVHFSLKVGSRETPGMIEETSPFRNLTKKLRSELLDNVLKQSSAR